MIIYKTTCLINGKIYIGQTIYNNKSWYLGSGSILRKAIKKYGKENFKREILEKVKNKKILNEREIYWIAFFNSTDKKIGYNLSKGGLGKNPWNKGLTSKTDERILKFSGKNNGMYGKKHTREAIQKMKNKKFSKKTRRLIGLTSVGKFKNENFKLKCKATKQRRLEEKYAFITREFIEDSIKRGLLIKDMAEQLNVYRDTIAFRINMLYNMNYTALKKSYSEAVFFIN